MSRFSIKLLRNCGWLCALAGLALLPPGCATGPEDTKPEPEASADAEQDEGPDDEVAETTRQMADRLAEAMDASPDVPDGRPDPGQPFAEPEQQIPWRQQDEPQPADDETDRTRLDFMLAPHVAALYAQRETEAPPEPAEPTTDDLFQTLAGRIADEETRPLAQALRGVGLSLAHPEQRMDPRLLATLTPEQRQQARRLYRFLHALHVDMLSPTGPDRDQLGSRLNMLLGPEPITIRRFELVRRVAGFGQYEPFPRRRFVAGQRNRMIAYLELEHFEPVEQSDGLHEVKLQQEFVLYNESDGLAVWRAEPVEIVDRSRNVRRDFFTRQLLTLPERLSVGKYVLKVRVVDQHGQSLDERSLNLEILADEELARQDDRP